ncbi:pseudouridine synthase [Thozetella sp. PMI_491]|nr:pseudouridine synthase [Thozetella sp. PMI_491]
MAANYDRWTKESLIERVKQLEAELRAIPPVEQTTVAATGQAEPSTDPPQDHAGPARRVPKKKKQIDPTKYLTRVVGLKLAYLGKNYNGFEFQNTTVQATIEEELWKALVKSCLIFPEKTEEVNFAPFEYSKCGRTDRGVSAFGQVINIRVRSNRPKPKDEPEGPPTETLGEGEDAQMTDIAANAQDGTEEKKSDGPQAHKPEWDPIRDEIDYCKVLNRLLPPDIRILAWCPNLPPDFDARFSCRERQYRYYFTQPAYSPMPASMNMPKGAATSRDGWLDIDAMRKAAKLFEGLHDFRNFCKVDPAKQISNFWRRMFECDIVEVKDLGSALPYVEGPDFRPETLAEGKHPKVYYFHVRGSAFLWHQIRHMVSVVLAVGQGFEQPSIVSDLLDVQKTPRRPAYTMAEEVPLVLWDCLFPDLSQELPQDLRSPTVPHIEYTDSINWIWVGEDMLSKLHGPGGLANQVWEEWRAKKMDEVLANQLLEAVVTKPNLGRQLRRVEKPRPSDRVFEGGNTARLLGVYHPIFKKRLLATPDEVNDKFAQSRGFPSSAEMAKIKNWRTVYKEAKRAKAVETTTPQGVEELAGE